MLAVPEWVWPSAIDWVWLLLLGLLGGIAQVLVTRAWRLAPAAVLAPFDYAGIVLAVLRCDQRPGDLAGGNGVHRTTVTRWVREVVGLLAARAPRLDRALKKIARTGERVAESYCWTAR